MPSTNNFKIPDFKYADIPHRLQRRQERIARSVYVPRFTRLVAPFESSIEFGIETERISGDIETRVGALPTGTVQRADGSTIDGATLYKFLDDGTAVRYAQLPGNFENETSPNSLSTSHQTYNRARIYIDKEADKSGLEARNFSHLVDLELAATYRQRMEAEIKKSIGQI